MKAAEIEKIEKKIQDLKSKLAKERQREREKSCSRILSVIEKNGISLDQAIAAIEAAANAKTAAGA